MGDPVVNRCKEDQARPKAFEELGQALQHFRKVLDLYKQKVGKCTASTIMYIQ